jgi:hypothetical protein
MNTAQRRQQDLYDRITAHAFFDTVFVAREFADENAGDALLDDQVKASLQGQLLRGNKCGLAIAIGSAKGKPTNRNGSTLLEDLTFLIQIVEHKGNNMSATIGTLIHCDDAFEELRVLIDNWSPNGHSAFQVREWEEDDYGDPALRGWVVEVLITNQAPRQLVKVARPVITDGETTLTMTCATSGASIYWTRDGTLPTPTNGSLYTAPVDDTSTDLILAIAYKSGQPASDCARLQLA